MAFETLIDRHYRLEAEEAARALTALRHRRLERHGKRPVDEELYIPGEDKEPIQGLKALKWIDVVQAQ